MEQIQALSPQAADRFDLYTGIHKALRRFMCDTLTCIAALDAGDDAEVAAGMAQLRELVDFCESHLQHENEFVHRAMEARRPGSSNDAAADHGHHAHAFTRLRLLAEATEQNRGAARAIVLAQLQRYLGVFVGENFIHMNMEETEHHAVLWATHTDAELDALHQALLASLTPREMASSLRWMIPAFSPSERAGLLAGMRAHAPAPAYQGALALAREHLAVRDWNKLAQALELDEKLAA